MKHCREVKADLTVKVWELKSWTIRAKWKKKQEKKCMRKGFDEWKMGSMGLDIKLQVAESADSCSDSRRKMKVVDWWHWLIEKEGNRGLMDAGGDDSMMWVESWRRWWWNNGFVGLTDWFFCDNYDSKMVHGLRIIMRVD